MSRDRLHFLGCIMFILNQRANLSFKKINAENKVHSAKIASDSFFSRDSYNYSIESGLRLIITKHVTIITPIIVTSVTQFLAQIKLKWTSSIHAHHELSRRILAAYVFNTVVFLRTTPEGLIQNDDDVFHANTLKITTSSVKHLRKRLFVLQNHLFKDISS